MMSYSNKYDVIFQYIYDAIPICRTHARTEPVRTPKFSSDNASDKRQFWRYGNHSFVMVLVTIYKLKKYTLQYINEKKN